MSPKDDPEARIRDLERSRSSELGTPSSAGAWSYRGSAAPPPGPRKRSGAAVVAIMVAVLGLAIAAAVGVYLLIGSGSNTTPGRPTFSGGGFPSTVPPADPPGITVPAPPSQQIENPQPGAVVTISGAGVNRTLACNDGRVIISGVGNTVELTGNCASVSVSGIENVITVDSSASIQVSGINNRVTYHSGTPQVGNSGFDNVVEQG